MKSSVNKHMASLPDWARKLAKSYILDELNNEEEHEQLRKIEELLRMFVDYYDTIPDQCEYPVVSIDELSACKEKVKKGNIKDELFWRLVGTIWLDQASMIRLYCLFVNLRVADLLTSFLRCIRTGDFLTSPILSRSLLELSVHQLSQIEIAVQSLEDLAASNDRQIGGDEFTKSVEIPIVQGIWGTKIGKSTLGDKASTLIHDNSYIDGMFGSKDAVIGQKNILTAFQKMAKRQAIGKSIYRVYDFLCEFTHPNALGNFAYVSSSKSIGELGSYLLTIGKTMNPEKTDRVVATALWAVGVACSTMMKVNIRLNKVLPEFGQKIEHLYGAPVRIAGYCSVQD